MEIMTTAMTLAIKTATELVIAHCEPMQHSKAVLSVLAEMKGLSERDLATVKNELSGIRLQGTQIRDAADLQLKAQAAQIAALQVDVKALHTFLAAFNTEAAQAVVLQQTR